MHRTLNAAVIASLTVLAIATTLDLLTEPAAARHMRGHHRAAVGRHARDVRGSRVGVDVAAGTFAAGVAATALGSYYNPYYGPAYYSGGNYGAGGSPGGGYYGVPGYGYYGYGN